MHSSAAERKAINKKRCKFYIMRYLVLAIFLAVFFSGLSQIRGVVVDDVDGTGIVGAAVKSFGPDSTLIEACATGLDGDFALAKGLDSVVFVEASFVGYETARIAIGADMRIGADNTIRLRPKSVTLEGVTVTAESYRREAGKETILLTDSIRNSAANAALMMDCLPGFKVDWISENVSIGQDKDVPIIVNGRNVGIQYAKSLNPKRIKMIEVLRFPPGEFSDYPILINIVLFENYVGWDVAARASGFVSTRNEHSNSESASADATYSSETWSVYGSMVYRRSDFYDAESYRRQIGDAPAEATVEIDVDRPNLRRRSDTESVSVGADRRLGDRHTISLQTWLDLVKSKRNEAYKMVDGVSQYNFDKYNSVNSITGLFYNGSISDRLRVYSNLLYNYYDIDENRDFINGGASTPSRIKGRKDYAYLAAYAMYAFNSQWYASLNYNYTWRKYESHEDGGENSFESKEDRHRAELALTYTPSNDFSARVGGNMLNIANRVDGKRDSHTTFIPRVQVHFRPFRWLSLSGVYYNEMMYPNFDQLSTSSWLVSANLVQTGNPDLRAEVFHYLDLRANILGFITLNYLWRKSDDNIVDWYELMPQGYVRKSFINCDYLSQYAGISIDKDIAKGLNLNFVGNYQWYKRWSAGRRNNGRTWYGDLTLTYALGDTGISFLGEYFLRHDMEPLPQGKSYNEEEALTLGANYRLLGNRLSITANVSLPVSLLDKRTYTKIDIPGYKSVTYSDDRVNASMVQLSVRYSIGNGKVKKSSNDYVIDTEK